jgi:hypothetical protein
MDKVFGQSVDWCLRSTDDLRTLTPMPSHWVDNKVIDHVDDLSKRFIAGKHQGNPLYFGVI